MTFHVAIRIPAILPQRAARPRGEQETSILVLYPRIASRTAGRSGYGTHRSPPRQPYQLSGSTSVGATRLERLRPLFAAAARGWPDGLALIGSGGGSSVGAGLVSTPLAPTADALDGALDELERLDRRVLGASTSTPPGVRATADSGVWTPS
ncbi:MAG: hypothetical protein M3N98_09595, partial [Actinomycetota bacterium]|nr:hypothetical protein [Actinomycetota bacterium]